MRWYDYLILVVFLIVVFLAVYKIRKDIIRQASAMEAVLPELILVVQDLKRYDPAIEMQLDIAIGALEKGLRDMRGSAAIARKGPFAKEFWRNG